MVQNTLVKLGHCSIDTTSSLGSDGTFMAPVDGVYKAVYNGVLKVSGEGKVHANILRRNSSGYLNTEVAGFAKLTSPVTDSLHGALLAVSESITSYVSLLAGEALCLGSGRDSQENSIA